MNKNKAIILLTLAILLILIGTKLNFTVMIENDGRMPLKWDFYSTEVDEYVLWNEYNQIEKWYLGDNFIVWIFAFSIGDLLIFIGVLTTIVINIKNVLGSQTNDKANLEGKRWN